MLNLPQIQHNINLRSFNTFGIEVNARFFVVVRTIAELRALLQDIQWQSYPKYVLGGGSNVLFTQHYEGLLIKNEIKGFDRIAEDDDSVFLKIGAGENWHECVLYCVEQGWGGIENLSLIAGTVGAAPIQNIGAYGVEFREVFHELEALSVVDGSVKIFDRDSCQFGYRDSVFKSIFKNQFIIASVTIKLSKKPQFNVSYGALQTLLNERKIKELTLKNVSDAVIHIRQSKLPDPKVIGNAGSFFKNPYIPADDFVVLQKQFVEMPYFAEESAGLIKIPAAWLIEQCGWKGKRVGDVGVHDKQALVLVNYGAGSGAAIQELAMQIQASVYERFGIQLVPEVNIV